MMLGGHRPGVNRRSCDTGDVTTVARCRAKTCHGPGMRGVVAAIVVLLAGFGPHEPDLVVAGKPVRDGRRATEATPVRARTAFAPLAAAGWRAIWDRDTGVAITLAGGHVDVPGSVANAAIAERAARAFVTAHADVLAPGAELVVISNRLDGAVRTIGFRQVVHGARVIGGELGVVFERDRLFAVSSSVLPNVPATTAPRATARAGENATRWLAAAGHRASVTATGERAILPLVRGPDDISYAVVDVLDARAPSQRWEVYALPDGTPLARHATIMHATGTLTFDAGVRYATGTRMAFPAELANLTVDGVATTTAVDGTFGWAGTAAATAIPSATGSQVVVIDHNGNPVTDMLDAEPGGTVAWSRATEEFADSQLSTYVYATIAKARARTYEPSLDPWLAQPMDFYVNEPDTCDAYSTGTEVHLFSADVTCQNTGRLADVVFHEFGHCVHFNSIIPGMGLYETRLSEGLADFNAANINEDSGVGRGFYYSDAPFREIDPIGYERVWPEDADPDPHLTGEIISGALWDLRKALIAELGHDAGVTATEQVFVGVLQRASDVPTSYMAALIGDDDDGDLGNGTPHFCAIQRAFGRHGLASDYQPTTIGAVELAGSTISIPITTPSGGTCPAQQATAVSVTINGVADPIALVASGGTWSGELPALPAGTIVQYTVTVAFDDGDETILPNNPADPWAELLVGPTTPIACEPFDNDPMWATTGTLGGEWQFGVPRAAPEGDPAEAATGVDVFGTALTFGYYQPGDTTTATMPVVDSSHYDRAFLTYQRWLTVEDGANDQATIAVDGAVAWANDPTLDHIDRQWRLHVLELPPGPHAISWQLASDRDSIELGGWTLDDVCIVGVGKIATCGDGVVDDGEQCDDGNTTPGDGCSATCTVEITAGGGGCNAGGVGGVGSLLVVALAGIRLRRRR